jgi:hypothetical protein
MRAIIPIPPLSPDQIARFESRLDMTDPNKCWEWDANRDPYHYGKFSIKHRSYRASRIAAYLWIGPPKSDGLFVLHSCDNPPCCNPAHLRWGTQSENLTDAFARKRHRAPTPPRQVLDPRQVREIRKSVESSRKIAPKYGVSYVQIIRIRNYKTWAWVQ